MSFRHTPEFEFGTLSTQNIMRAKKNQQILTCCGSMYMVCHCVIWTHNLHILLEDGDSAENERIPLPNLPNPSFFDKNVSLSVAG